jgi:tetratricopeptide (TPR) repeat protein
MPLKYASFSSRVLVAVHAFCSYLGKMIVPVHLAPLYPYPQDVRFLAAPFFLSTFFVLAIAFGCTVEWKARKAWSVLWAYYAITLLPVIGLIQVGYQSMADRYTYLPSLGPFMSIGLFAAWSSHRISHFTSAAGKKMVGLLAFSAAVAVLLILPYQTRTQIAVWKNSLTLWNYEIATEPAENPVAYFHRGNAYQEKAQYEWAIRDYNNAITLKPDFYEALNNRGTLYDELDQLDLAIRDYTQSLALKPHFKIYYNRGVSYARAGLFEKAIEDFTHSLSLYPDNAGAYVNRGFAYNSIGDRQRARLDFEKGCVRGNEIGCRQLIGSARSMNRPRDK